MKVKKVIEQIEHIFGRQSEGYMIQLINDALIDIGSTKQHLLEEKKIDLIEDQRWYDIDDNMIDITRVEIKDTNDRYVMIPKLSNAEKLLKGDDI
jgi:hypothetical protein|tara:strand:+ start:4994 stop:5278 length:285 start_codon:yes stop_codon:yes gene_type:complete